MKESSQRDGRDVTEEYVRGAEETLQIAREKTAGERCLKREALPAAVVSYMTELFKKLIPGDGITVRLLKKPEFVCMEKTAAKKAEP